MDVAVSFDQYLGITFDGVPDLRRKWAAVEKNIGFMRNVSTFDELMDLHLKKQFEDQTCSSEHMIMDRQTKTHSHAHHNTLLPYWSSYWRLANLMVKTEVSKNKADM